MNECVLSDEICLYISAEDFNKLVSVPNLSESDISFREVPSIKSYCQELDLA